MAGACGGRSGCKWLRGTLASSPRAPCRLARVSMKPRCRLHEPIRFINCSTSSFYSSIFIQIRGICVPIRKRKISLERGAGSLIKRKQSQRHEAHCFVSQLRVLWQEIFSFWALREGGRSLDESALSGFAAPPHLAPSAKDRSERRMRPSPPICPRHLGVMVRAFR